MDVSPLCAGSTMPPTLLSSTSILVGPSQGGITLELATFACNVAPAVVPLAAEGGVITWLLPDAASTTTKTTTATRTTSTKKRSTKTTTSHERKDHEDDDRDCH